MVVRRGGKGGGDSEGRERQKGREPVAFEEAHNNRGHWRIWHFWSSWPSTFHPLVRFAQLCPPLLRRPPFDFTFYFDSIFLPVLFPYYLVLLVSGPRHSLSLSLPPPAPSMPRASILFFPLEPGLSGPSAEGRLLFPPRSCFYFPSAFLPPLFRPRLLFHLLFSRHPPNWTLCPNRFCPWIKSFSDF